MTLAQILGYPLLPIAALDLFLGLLLLKQNPRKSRVNWATAICALSASVWSISTALMFIRCDRGLDYLFFARLNWVGWFTVPSALQSALYLENEQSRTAHIAGWVFYPFWTIVLLLCLSTNLIVTDGYIPIPYQNAPGPLEMPLRLIGGLSVMWLIYELLSVRKRSTGTRRAQLGWYLYGTIFFGLGGAVGGGFLQLFTGQGMEPSLSSYTSFPWVLMIFYAISRYRLFDVRLALSRITGALLLSMIIAVIHYGLNKELGPLLGELATTIISITVIGLTLFATTFAKNLQQMIDDMLLGERQMYHQMLHRSSQAMISILRIDELMHFVADAIRGGMKSRSVTIYLAEPIAVEGSQRCYSTDARHCSDALPDTVLMTALQSGRTLQLAEQENAEGEEAQAITEAMRRQELDLVLPIMLKGRLLGSLMLGDRDNGAAYVASDVELLQAVASQASVAVENARLFEEAGRTRESLQRSEEKFRILANTLTAAVVIHAGGRLLYANPAASQLTGYSNEELLSKDFRSLVHPEHIDLVAQRASARLSGDSVPQQYEFRVVTKSGDARWALTNTGMLVFEGQKSIIATLFDITDLKQAEVEKELLYNESAHQYRQRIKEQQHHQEEKENILKDLHDGVGGLTTNINLLAELARKNDNISDIRKSLKTIADLSRESLAEIRTFKQSLDTRELDWPSIAAELRDLGNTIVEPHGIHFALDTSLDTECRSPTSVMMLNIFRIYKETLANIIKHARAKTVTVSFSVDKTRTVLSVKDDGVGIGEKKKKGRGLHNIQTRADELGGTLAITSGGEGTHIYLEVPVP